ncbi:MAG: hypothetical protein F4X62_05470 [Caldilineaceae bacterium SB0662_bin_25]|nr:hypothetical protein [Caldilineaceae bacterium SB0662_bin_25]
MKDETRIPAAKTRGRILLAVLFAAVAALSFLTKGETKAQTATLTPTATADAGAVPNLSAQATARGVELSWEALPNAVRYELLTWWDLSTGWRPIGGDSLTGTSYTHTSVVAGTLYHYSIRAIFADGEGPWLSSDYPTAVAPAPATTERDALIALYEATDGDNWTQNSNWLSDRPLSAWHGVTTDASGHVTHLNLGGNHLSGPLPDLSALSYLEELALSSNLLTGPIPNLNAFGSLATLALSHNRLTGPIPNLSSLTSLKTLYLINNQLSGPIPDLSALTNLIYLDLMRNRLSGPIPDLSNLTSLRALSLGHNRLTGSVPDLRAHSNLRSLALQHNQLSGPIPDLTHSNLNQLNLTGNQLCMPQDRGFSGQNQAVIAHLRTLNLSPCTDATPTPTATASTLTVPKLTAQATTRGVVLSWEALPNAVRYELLTYWASDPGWQPIGGNSLAGTSYTHTSAVAGTLYYYSIRAIFADGEGPWLSSDYPTAVALAATGEGTATPTTTATQAAGTPTSTPTPTATADAGAVPNLSAQATARGVELSWEALPNAVRYELLTWWDLSTGWRPIGGDSLTGTSYTHTSVVAGTLYHYSIRAIFADGEGPWLSSDYPTAVAPAPATTERDALIALYEATDGDNWTQNSNWLSDRPLSAWHGVTTDASGHVTHLNLGGNHLSGPLPDLSALSYLEELALSSNLLTGPIPNLNAFGSLATLALSHNRLTGPIPNLSSLTSLKTLYLINNQLSGPIPDLSALTNLIYLDLMRNRLSGPIPDLSNLTSLRALSLGHNRLTGSVPDLRALPNLGSLALQHNQLSGPIPDLTGSNLRQLNLTGNQLCVSQGADFSRGNQVVVAHFRTLNLSPCTDVAPPPTSQTPTATATSTTSTQPAPDSAEERAALVALYRATDGANWKNNANWLTSAPLGTWHGVFTDEDGHVIELRLEQNGLRGSLSALNAFTYLTTLFLYDNQLTGPIPELSALTNLEYVWLSDNQFSGPIPALKTLTNLRYLDLAYNQLTGPIPDLSALTNLQQLILISNRLTGSIPDLSASTYLWNLTLSENQLTGSIAARSLPPDLWVLSLDTNQLTGTIPDLSTHTNLSYLRLDTNQLTGPILDLGALTNLTSIFLGNNQLTGSIPDVSALTKLRSLSLGNNQLTGSIPDVSTLTELDYLRLDSNQLTGPMPDVSALTKLTSLTLSYNQLTGPILNLNHLTRLTSLSLRYNQLTGPVPDLSGLTNLTWLTLRGNQLCLPQGVGLSGANEVVREHLNSLNLPTCTAAELALTPGVPQNLTATVGDGQVTLTWSAVANAAGYEVRVWDSINREWGGTGGDLSVTSHTHTVLKDGRNYYYQVRARDVNGVRGAWSEQVYAAVDSPRYPPPPLSLELDMFYQKYLETNGVAVVAPSDVSDAQMGQAREIITGILSNRADLLQTIAANDTIIFIEIDDIRGIAFKIPGGWEAYVRADDPNCENFIHEFAHVIHFAIEDQADGPAFNTRLRSLYQSALNAGLWEGMYASTEAIEYWAETVKYWLWGSSPYTGYATLADYDPEIAKLIEEELSGATVPATCRP